MDDLLAFRTWSEEKSKVEARFDANMREFGDRVRKVKATSALGLAKLREENARFDVIYIDADHSRDNVLIDSLLAWPLLENAGAMMWDDYEWGLDKPVAQRPKQGIDTFLWLHRDDLDVVNRRRQVFAIKRKSAKSELDSLKLVWRMWEDG